ncbi:hypothetical protein KUCAC02_003309 [Chaenocephalus aceratus]|uniref:Uncharacterized protein n=1 Tax=Chaenocephalus aceratus TaxID=36190 RepID=A0ACB9WK73_CHAAC|nr:hypothetical protein KUCAC02_003309 [Chaenocephalus aceratus]
MPQKVIWRHKGERPSTLGNNTLIVDWMPQKDLLGHPQTKVFVAHGGTNGVQEAIYHGVPVLGIPLFFDQYDNLLRLQHRGAGKIIELADRSANDPNGSGHLLGRICDAYKGAPHLRTEAYKMPWFLCCRARRTTKSKKH